MKKYKERQVILAEKEELRRKNVELQEAQIALQAALEESSDSGGSDSNDEKKTNE